MDHIMTFNMDPTGGVAEFLDHTGRSVYRGNYRVATLLGDGHAVLEAVYPIWAMRGAVSQVKFHGLTERDVIVVNVNMQRGDTLSLHVSPPEKEDNMLTRPPNIKERPLLDRIRAVHDPLAEEAANEIERLTKLLEGQTQLNAQLQRQIVVAREKVAEAITEVTNVTQQLNQRR